MNIQIRYQEGEKFITQTRQHQFNIDQPKEKGGSDLGMNPLGVFLSAVGSCIAVYAKRYCQGAKLDYSKLAVDIESQLSQDKPIRLKDIKVKIGLGYDIGSKKEPLLQFVKNCPIHNTISNKPEVEIRIQ